MSSSRGYRWRWASAWVPVVACAAIIFVESTPAMGADHTREPLRRLFEALFGRVSEPAWDTIHHLIRKSGHFLGYGTIALAWMRAWRMSLPGRSGRLCAELAMAGTALLASADEIHQTFLPNRTGTPWDVLLDCCGAAVLLAVAHLLKGMRRPRALAPAASRIRAVPAPDAAPHR